MRKSKREKEKEREEAKRKEEEALAAKTYAEFLDAFEGDSRGGRGVGSRGGEGEGRGGFVRAGAGGTYDPASSARGAGASAVAVVSEGQRTSVAKAFEEERAVSGKISRPLSLGR